MMIHDSIVDKIPSATVSVVETSSAESSISSTKHHHFYPAIQSGGSDAATVDGPVKASIVRNRCEDSVREGNESTRPLTSNFLNSENAFGAQTSTLTGDVDNPLKRKRLVVDRSKGALKKPRVGGNVLHSEFPVLLAQEEDVAILSDLHILVRQRVEVFTATEDDLAQPAPGRKNPIQLHQVGLRCIHCRDLPPRNRVKRAICYPSSVSRVYHSVSDMKFDHFTACKGLPTEIRSMFNELKGQSKKKRDQKPSSKPRGCSSSTAQFYHDSAHKMGLVDRVGGVFMAKELEPQRHQIMPATSKPSGIHVDQRNKFIRPQNHCSPTSMSALQAAWTASTMAPTGIKDFNNSGLAIQLGTCRPMIGGLPASFFFGTDVIRSPLAQAPSMFPVFEKRQGDTSRCSPIAKQDTPNAQKHGPFRLACEDDEIHLNPIHCFVRRHVELFEVNEADINAPAPGRKTRVRLGQVGIRCIHCVILSPKEKVKRAVCYPPSVGGIYHSVSNMKFDHFAICRGLPDKARVEFNELRASSTRGLGCLASSKGSGPSSTAQYYQDSAARFGVVDTDQGMRFQMANTTISQQKTGFQLPSKVAGREEDVGEADTRMQRIPDGLTALMIAAADPNVVRANWCRAL